MTAPGTACAREGCGHSEHMHKVFDFFDRVYERGPCAAHRCACDSYVGRSENLLTDDAVAALAAYLAPTPTADKKPCGWCDHVHGEGFPFCDSPGPGDGPCICASIAPPRWAHPDTERADDLTRSGAESALVLAGAAQQILHQRLVAAVERARTAEAHVEKMRDLVMEMGRRDTGSDCITVPPCRAVAERDAARAEATATREAVERVRATWQSHLDAVPLGLRCECVGCDMGRALDSAPSGEVTT